MPQQIRYIFAGDLLGQLIATSFGVEELEIPLFGLYGACSTCGETLSLAAMTVSAGYADQVLAVTSSHLEVRKSSFDFRSDTGIKDLFLRPGPLPEAELFCSQHRKAMQKSPESRPGK